MFVESFNLRLSAVFPPSDQIRGQRRTTKIHCKRSNQTFSSLVSVKEVSTSCDKVQRIRLKC